MSYEHCEKHDLDATNGCPMCLFDARVARPVLHRQQALALAQAIVTGGAADRTDEEEDLARALINMMPRWRTEHPTAEELADPRIVGWILRNNDDLDIIVRRDAELWLTGDVHPMGLDKFPLLLADIQISTEWCPIYAPEEP